MQDKPKQGVKRSAVPPPRARPTVRRTREALQRARDEGWAWEAMHRCVRRVVDLLARGQLL